MHKTTKYGTHSAHLSVNRRLTKSSAVAIRKNTKGKTIDIQICNDFFAIALKCALLVFTSEKIGKKHLLWVSLDYLLTMQGVDHPDYKMQDPRVNRTYLSAKLSHLYTMHL